MLGVLTAFFLLTYEMRLLPTFYPKSHFQALLLSKMHAVEEEHGIRYTEAHERCWKSASRLVETLVIWDMRRDRLLTECRSVVKP